MFASGNIKEVVFDFKVCISEQSSVDDLLKENHLPGGFLQLESVARKSALCRICGSQMKKYKL